MDIIGVIPARFDSSRFPGKPLTDIAGKTMIQRVYEQVRKVELFSAIVVATDDQRIADHVHSFGGKAIMTAQTHVSGTDRCAEVLQHYPATDIAINIQGDEPFINPEQIHELITCFQLKETKIATLVRKISTAEELFNTNIPKVVVDSQFKALYFSRHPIPYQRNLPEDQWLNGHTYYKHIGIYGFRAETLREITQLPLSSLEKAESLEQLRWLENGYPIQTAETVFSSMGVDHPDDVMKVLKKWKGQL